jgi:hypothetical protein
LIGNIKQKIKKDRIYYCVGTDKNRKLKGKKMQRK